MASWCPPRACCPQQGAIIAMTFRFFGRMGTVLVFITFAVLPIVVINRAARLDRIKGVTKNVRHRTTPD